MTNEVKAPPQISWKDPKGMRTVAGGVTAARGFVASGVVAGIKSAAGKADLACLFSDRPAAWAAACMAAPVSPWRWRRSAAWSCSAPEPAAGAQRGCAAGGP
jgi:hypothetical protein